MSVDETWTATSMTRSHGRCRRGERRRMGYQHGHCKTTTLVAGLRRTGMVAPTTARSHDGPVNGDRFEAYVGQVLVPDLRPGDVVTMDNLSSHKRASVGAPIEAAGAHLLLVPPYSPIEKAFARLKAIGLPIRFALGPGRIAYRQRWGIEGFFARVNSGAASPRATTNSPPTLSASSNSPASSYGGDD